MHKYNESLLPRTYSIKSHRRRGSISFRKVLLYAAVFIFATAALIITILSLNQMI